MWRFANFGAMRCSPSALVLGLGPAGRIAAYRAAARGWSVCAIDPTGGRMPSTIGAWAGQLPQWLPADVVAACAPALVITSTGRERQLGDDYVVFDVDALGRLGADTFEVLRQRAIHTTGFQFSFSDASSQRSVVARWWSKLRGLFDVEDAFAGAAVMHEYFRVDPRHWPEDFVDPLGPGGSLESFAQPDLLVDTIPVSPLLARQLAFGQVFEEADLPVTHRRLVLMDFTVAGQPHPEMPATFSYRIPLGDGRWLVEETILATTVGDRGHAEALHAYLREQQRARLEALGIDAGCAVDEEVVDFPLGPWKLQDQRPRRAIADKLRNIPVGSKAALDLSWLVPFSGNNAPGEVHFGAAGGWMHPATGYSVGAVLADVDRVLDRGLAGKNTNPPGGVRLGRLRRLGLAVLLSFSPDQTRVFFDAFFRLSDRRIFAYLTGSSLRGTALTMVSLLPHLVPHRETLSRLLVTAVSAVVPFRTKISRQRRVMN
ncbi:hypothetical protein KRX51_05810 [Corynebacterium sp. TAE3-ERU12]|uniref:lycopene cyclase family protein n=1 Tax=Corynebacterium sp. TAE3-ERU12 TaxID=2849491 RepID=UPI001C485E05|nr:lycopene cyclase family protein [Corynebacterium sp. TAE3-ERU12]MBV7295434.1 hypothetical protein [Corynebacterium sp. TAE3-ERU12]